MGDTSRTEAGGEATPPEKPRRLGRGLNLGNYLEFPAPIQRVASRRDFGRMKEAGFDTVRIPVCWAHFAKEEAPFALDGKLAGLVRDHVDWAIEAGLKVVLNVHHYREFSDPSDSHSVDYHVARLAGIWRNILALFPGEQYPADRLFFELCNEPNGRIGSGEWNRTLEAILPGLIPLMGDRLMVIGTAAWGRIDGLTELSLPAACNPGNTIVTIHIYEPFPFTHQGAQWMEEATAWKGTRWTGTEEEKRPLLELFNAAEAWNTAGYEMYVGEFGAYGRYAALDERAAWTSFIVSEAQRRGMSWAYWEYSAGFGVWDQRAEAWRRPLLDALLGSRGSQG